MDRLIALVGLRWKTDLRAMSGAGERWLLLLALPVGFLFSIMGAVLAFVALRAAGSAWPESLPGLVSVLATALGTFWALSPLLAGVAFSEAHDAGRLMHFPVRLGTLVVSSLLANLIQPMVLAEIPIIVGVSLALAGRLWTLPLTVIGVSLTFAFILTASQAVGLILHGLSRNRRWHDAALVVGLGLGLTLALTPVLLLTGAGRPAGALARTLIERDLLALSPFGWGVRAAVLGGRGDLAAFILYSSAALAAIGTVMALSAFLTGRIYRGELVLGPRPGRVAGRWQVRVPGTVGALIEKDLRLAWREPALKAILFTGLLAPLLFLFFLTSAGGLPRGSHGAVLLLASFVGLSGFGSNTFGLERRGVGLLFAFPVARWRILVAKNMATLIFRLPGLATLLLAALLLAPLSHLPAALTVLAATLLVAAGLDNYVSILFPITMPAPGQNPYQRRSGGRGLGTALLISLLMGVVLLLSAPFAFLAWLPLLMETHWLWVASLPLALAGAAAVYGMLVAGAERLLQRREPDLLQRILGEA